MIEQASLIIGDGNWAVKSGSLLGYALPQGKYVPRDMTFTRATTGTRVNAAGLVEVVPYNLFSYSEDFSNIYWNKTGGSAIVSNTTTAPNGTLTADTFITASGSMTNRMVSSTLDIIGQTVCVSIYAKSNTFNRIRLSNNISNVISADFNLDTGTLVGTTGSVISTSVSSVGNGWYRCSMSYVATDATVLYRMPLITSGISSSIFVWGAQLAEGTQPLTYLPTTDRLDIPRIDYSTGSAALLLEPQRTNLFTYSESTNNFSSFGQSNTAYSSGNGFNGFQSSCKITFSTFTNSFPRAVLVYNAISGQNNYFTLHFKKKSGFYVQINFGNATSVFTIQLNLGTGELISTSGTAVGNTKVLIIGDDTYQVGFLTSTNGTTVAGLLNIDFFNNSSFSNWTNSNASDFALISGIQWENQVTYGTSYIPTKNATVTRNADACTKTGISSLIGQTEGTIFLDLDNILSNSDWLTLNPISGSPYTNGIGIGYFAAALRFQIYSPTGTVFATLPPISGKNKIALAYKSGDTVIYINGVNVFSSAGTFSFGVLLDSITVGSSSWIVGSTATNKIYSHSLYNTRLTNSELIQLTTP
jgi:hypothetical protein